jgi:hypothetical protein
VAFVGGGEVRAEIAIKFCQWILASIFERVCGNHQRPFIKSEGKRNFYDRSYYSIKQYEGEICQLNK